MLISPNIKKEKKKKEQEKLLFSPLKLRIVFIFLP